MNVDEIQKIVDNAMELSDCNSEAKLARKMGMLPQNFNQKKKRGTIKKAINRFLKTAAPNDPKAPSPAVTWDQVKTLCAGLEKRLDEQSKRIDLIEQLIRAAKPLKTQRDTGKRRRSAVA